TVLCPSGALPGQWMRISVGFVAGHGRVVVKIDILSQTVVGPIVGEIHRRPVQGIVPGITRLQSLVWPCHPWIVSWPDVVASPSSRLVKHDQNLVNREIITGVKLDLRV